MRAYGIKFTSLPDYFLVFQFQKSNIYHVYDCLTSSDKTKLQKPSNSSLDNHINTLFDCFHIQFTEKI